MNISSPISYTAHLSLIGVMKFKFKTRLLAFATPYLWCLLIILIYCIWLLQISSRHVPNTEQWTLTLSDYLISIYLHELGSCSLLCPRSFLLAHQNFKLMTNLIGEIWWNGMALSYFTMTFVCQIHKSNITAKGLFFSQFINSFDDYDISKEGMLADISHLQGAYIDFGYQILPIARTLFMLPIRAYNLIKLLPTSAMPALQLLTKATAFRMFDIGYTERLHCHSTTKPHGQFYSRCIYLPFFSIGYLYRLVYR